MKKLIVGNYFHRTTATIEVLETYEAKHGGLVAVVRAEDLDWASRVLCGMDDCTCSGPHGAEDEDGNVYALTV